MKDDLTDTLDKFEDFDNFERKEGQSLHECESRFDFRGKSVWCQQ